MIRVLASTSTRFFEQIGFQKGVATCVDCIWEVFAQRPAGRNSKLVEGELALVQPKIYQKVVRFMGFCTLRVFSDNILNRALYGEESSVMFIEGISILPFSDGTFANQIVFDCATASPLCWILKSFSLWMIHGTSKQRNRWNVVLRSPLFNV